MCIRDRFRVIIASQPQPFDMSKNFNPFVVVALIEIIFSLIPSASAKEAFISFLCGEIFGELRTIETSILAIFVLLGIFFTIFFKSLMLEMLDISEKPERIYCVALLFLPLGFWGAEPQQMI